MKSSLLLKLDIQFFAEEIDPLSPTATLIELKPKLDDLPVYPGDVLFPDGPKQDSLELKYIKGVGGLPVVLKPSDFDAKAPIRYRQDTEGLSMEMPVFREEYKMTEKEWRDYVIKTRSAVDAAIKSAYTRIYDDRLELIRGARAQNERMKMQLLSTGKIGINENREWLDYDYQLPKENIVTVEASDAWSNPDADVLGTLEKIKDQATDAGIMVSRAMMTSKTLRGLRKNEQILALSAQQKVRATSNAIVDLFKEEYGLDVVLNDLTFKEANEHKVTKFFPDNVVSFFGEGRLGQMVYSYTSEEMLLQADPLAKVEVEVYGVGLALTRMVNEHTPTHELMASQICLPSFEESESVIILNTEVTGEDTP